MLQMEKVTKVYRTSSLQTYALSDIDIEVTEGGFLALMGPSGCGKTTFLNIAGLLDVFDSGIYRLDGADVSRLTDSQMSRFRNQKIGFVFQSFNLIPDLNVVDNVDVPLRYRGIAARQRREKVIRATDRVGLSARLNHFPNQLSGGQQQRVAIARALVGEPSLILADEPTGNLDSRMAAEIMDLLAEINEAGATIVMVTHDPGIASRAKETIYLRDGKVVSDPGLVERQLRSASVS